MVQDWWVTFFDELYRVSDLDAQPGARTRQQVECVREALRLKPGARVLDLACGTGRHAVLLAEMGFQVTGVDLNRDYLSQAQRRAAASGVALEVVCTDMRDLSAIASGRFDAVISMYTSFGFFADPGDNLRVLGEVGRVLAKRGTLLLDVLNRDWLLRTFGPSDFAHRSGEFAIRDYEVSDATVYLHENAFQPATSMLRWTITEAGSPGQNITANFRVYSFHEVRDLLGRAGFDVVEAFGDYDRRPFQIFSPRIICCARR